MNNFLPALCYLRMPESYTRVPEGMKAQKTGRLRNVAKLRMGTKNVPTLPGYFLINLAKRQVRQVYSPGFGQVPPVDNHYGLFVS